MDRQADVVVIGAGIIGAATAYYAARRGAKVLILEKGEVCSGASLANAGLVVPSFSTPIPKPQIFRDTAKLLFDRTGPLSLRFRPEVDFILWLVKFLKHCNQKDYDRAVGIYARFNKLGSETHEELAGLGGEGYEYRREGLLYLFTTPEVQKETCDHAAYLRTLGVPSTELDRSGVRELEPNLRDGVLGGLIFHDDAVLDPAGLVRWLVEEVVNMGGGLVTDCETYDFAPSGRRVAAVKTTKGDFRGDQVVLAAGAWTPVLAKRLGRRVPIEAGKGYSFTFPRPRVCPSMALMLEDAHIAVSPYKNFLRMTSLMDLHGLDLAIDPKRIAPIRPKAEAYFPGLSELVPEMVWRGLRPCSPDGLPIAGRLAPWSNVLVAGGHDMKGISLGPATGRLMAGLLAGGPEGELERVFSPDRF